MLDPVAYFALGLQPLAQSIPLSDIVDGLSDPFILFALALIAGLYTLAGFFPQSGISKWLYAVASVAIATIIFCCIIGIGVVAFNNFCPDLEVFLRNVHHLWHLSWQLFLENRT